MLALTMLGWVAVPAIDASAAARDRVERTARTTVGADPSVLVVTADRPTLTGQTKRTDPNASPTSAPDAGVRRAERSPGVRVLAADRLADEHPLAVGLARRGSSVAERGPTAAPVSAPRHGCRSGTPALVSSKERPMLFVVSTLTVASR